MKSQEAKELGQLAGQQLRQVTGVVHGAHTTITGAVHGALRRALGPMVNPVLQTIDTFTGGVYAVTGLGLDGASGRWNRCWKTTSGTRRGAPQHS